MGQGREELEGNEGRWGLLMVLFWWFFGEFWVNWR